MEKLLYYTLRDRQFEPVGMLCIGEKNYVRAYGLTLCSSDDRFSYGKGRKVARNRCLDAMSYGPYSESMHNELSTDISKYRIWRLNFNDYRRLHRVFDMCTNIEKSKCGRFDMNFTFNDVMVMVCLEDNIEDNI